MQYFNINKNSLPLILLFFLSHSLTGQMWNGQDTLYGNEWINYDLTYYKIKVAEDGFYRLTYEGIQSQGLPSNLNGRNIQLFHMGREVPLYVTTEGPLQSGDYLEFYGEKNRSEMDRYFFQDPDVQMLNPEYSLYTDTAAYYLTWSTENGLRYEPQNNDLTNLPAKETWYWGRELYSYNDQFAQYKFGQNGSVSFSHFEKGEGFGGPASNRHNVIFKAPEAYTSGPGSHLKVRLVSDRNLHNLVVSINQQKVYQDTLFFDYTMHIDDYPLSSGTLQNDVLLEIEGLRAGNDNYRLAIAELRYPRQFRFDQSSLARLEARESAGRQYFELQEFDVQGGKVILYSPKSRIRIEAQVDQGMARFAWEPEAGETFFVINDGKAPQPVNLLEPVTFADYRNSDTEFIIISHPRLMAGANNQVEAYAAYRRSVAGGNYQTTVIDVHQLYEQFGYGIKGHAQAFRNFGHFIMKNWSSPRFVLLIGKGFSYDYLRHGNEPIKERHLIPTFGAPGSDNLLFSTNTSPVSLLPVGRIAAENGTDIRNYLEKVTTYEASFALPLTFDNHAWRKKVLHLKGGNPQEFETGTISNELDSMAVKIMENKIGATVTSFKKTSTEPVAQSVSESVIQAFNNGILIKTFFGHGAVVNTDFGLDDPEIFDNKDKFPLVFSLGCLTGNLFTTEFSVSERFLLAKNKGAICYIAASGYGTVLPLGAIAEDFYDLAGNELFTHPIGEILNRNRGHFFDSGTFYRTLSEQLSLHGDPVLKLHQAQGPDFVTDFRSVRIGPEQLSVDTDSLEVSFTLGNIGAAIEDTLFIRYEHTLPNGETLSYLDSVHVNGSFTPVTSRLPLGGTQSAGVNTLRILLDPDNRIAESPNPGAEQNNGLQGPNGESSVSFFVFENAVQPIQPLDFSIVAEGPVELIAATPNLFDQEQNYAWEIDTTARFNSPLKQTREVSAAGGKLSWSSTIPLLDNTVYYWQVSPKLRLNGQDTLVWRQASFLYKNDLPPGWNQSHYFQYLNNDLNNIQLDSINRQWQFENTLFGVTAESVMNGPANSTRSRVLYNNDRIYLTSGTDGKNLSITTFDGFSGLPNNSTGRRFRMHTPEGRKAIMDYLDNVVKAGDFVIVMTYHEQGQSYFPEEWAADSIVYGRNLFQVLEEQGASQVRQLDTLGSVPYVVAFRKDQELISEKIADAGESSVFISFSVPGKWHDGDILSTMIGPAKSWENLLWENSSLDNPDTDSLGLTLFGLTHPKDTLTPLMTIDQQNTDLSALNPDQYPFLRLGLATKDSINRTPTQLDHWRIHYKAADDYGLQLLAFEKDTLSQGEDLQLKMAIYNLSDTDLDSIGLQLTLTGLEDNQVRTTLAFPKDIPAKDTIVYSWAFDSRVLRGGQSLRVDLNPDRRPLETSYINNFGFKEFYVRYDDIDPVLDVTFDGIHIMDGDLVSPTPLILIELEDENRFLFLNDTALMNLRLMYPDGTIRNLNFDGNEVRFYPPSGNKNRARIELTPSFEIDGIYQLIANGRDASGNVAGEREYKVNFEVKTASSISRMLPYPNPFTTRTRFQYTFTGSRMPTYFLIRIMTVSGRIVKEISQAEFGPLHVGTHLSEFVWDGTDNFGDRLANGVYLYQMIVKDEEMKDFDTYERGLDQYFKADIGKIVILR